MFKITVFENNLETVPNDTSTIQSPNLERISSKVRQRGSSQKKASNGGYEEKDQAKPVLRDANKQKTSDTTEPRRVSFAPGSISNDTDETDEDESEGTKKRTRVDGKVKKNDTDSKKHDNASNDNQDDDNNDDNDDDDSDVEGTI